MPKSSPKRSPIADDKHPLPVAGESVSRMLFVETFGLMFSAILAIVAVGAGAAAWLDRFYPLSNVGLPIVTVFTGSAAVTAAWVGWQSYRKLGNLVLGMRGERVVAACLERLRTRGYEVFHDIPEAALIPSRAERNIDHLLVGPAGVLVIETKAMRKAGGPDEKLSFDGERLCVRGRPLGEDWQKALRQVEANARTVRRNLKGVVPGELVHAALVFPGWFVEDRGDDVRGAEETWVLNPEGIGFRLSHQPVRMEGDAVRVVSQRIADEVRRHLLRERAKE